jgi:hypothetical protein
MIIKIVPKAAFEFDPKNWYESRPPEKIGHCLLRKAGTEINAAFGTIFRNS